MNKTKKLTAIFLCIAMLFGIGATGASAYEVPVAGELTEGVNRVCADEGTYIYDYSFSNKYRVNFTDGTSAETSSTVILPNGKEYYVNSSINNEAVIEVYIVNHTYIEQKLPIEEASFDANYDYLTRITNYHFSLIKDDWYYVFVGRQLESFGMTLSEHISYIIEIMPALLKYTIVNLQWSLFEFSEFCNYYMGTPIIHPFYQY